MFIESENVSRYSIHFMDFILFLRPFYANIQGKNLVEFDITLSIQYAIFDQNTVILSVENKCVHLDIYIQSSIYSFVDVFSLMVSNSAPI